MDRRLNCVAASCYTHPVIFPSRCPAEQTNGAGARRGHHKTAVTSQNPIRPDKCPDTIVYSSIIVESSVGGASINEPGPRRSAGLRCNKRATDQLFGQAALTFRQRKYMGISVRILKNGTCILVPRINELLYTEYCAFYLLFSMRFE